MRRPLAALALALACLAAGCSKSPCQELGEKLCACTGVSGSDCEAQVKDQLDQSDPGDATCDAFLATCNAPDGADFCQWLLTEDGKRGCGLAPPAQ